MSSEKVDFKHFEDFKESGNTSIHHESKTVIKRPMHSELAAALAKEKPEPWSRRMLRLYCVLFVAYLCSATNGFDSNTFGGASALTSFQDYFSLHGGSKQGLIAASYVIGNMVGSLGAGQVSDKWGRKYGMGIGSFICLIGAIVQTAAKDANYLIGGRVVLGLGASIAQTAGPAYVVELSHPAYRAVLTGLYQANFFLGTILSTWIEFGLSYVPGNPQFQWRVPMALQALPSVLVLAFIWFIPETPRWYISHGDDERAREILARYHGGGNLDSEIVALQMREMKEVVGLPRPPSNPGDRHRFFLVACIAFFGQWDLPPTSYYFPLLVELAGVTNEHIVLLLNALQTPIMMIAALCGLRQIEKWGRRPTLLFSSTGMCLCVVAITVCTALTSKSPKAGPAGIAFLYLFLVVFAFVWTPMQALYPVEVLGYNNRAKGLAVMNLLVNTAGLFNTYLPPVAISAVSWRFYLFYATWDAFGVFVIYFTFVETKGRNLEEIDAIFLSEHPVKTSLMNETKTLSEI